MKLGWITDPHLLDAFVDEDVEAGFYEAIRMSDADAFVVTGDFGEASNVTNVVERIAEAASGRTVYIVLGNHDFYGGTIGDVRYRVNQIATRPGSTVVYLTMSELQSLTETAAIVGHDGWGDARAGEGWRSEVRLNDFRRIADLMTARAMAGQFGMYARMGELGDEAARHLREVLTAALMSHREVWVATHVPPFVETAWHNGHPSDPNFAPFFVCQAVGDLLLELADAYPDRKITVLCGHTHGSGEMQMRPNLLVYTGGTEYGAPRIQRVFELQ